MRLLIINGNTTPEMTDKCAAAARTVAAAGTEITAVNAVTGPRVITTRTENALAINSVVELFARCGDEADAILIAVSFDTGLDAVREAASVPVLGMTEAAVHAAAFLGGPIGFIGPGRRVLNIYRDTVARTGLASRVVGYRAIDMKPEDYLTPGNTVEQVVAAALDLVETDAVESIVLAGAAYAGFVEDIQARVPVPIIDGIPAGVALAEALVSLGRPQARAGSYAALPERHISGYSEEIRAMFSGSQK